jgi:hypothetical protein
MGSVRMGKPKSKKVKKRRKRVNSSNLMKSKNESIVRPSEFRFDLRKIDGAMLNEAMALADDAFDANKALEYVTSQYLFDEDFDWVLDEPSDCVVFDPRWCDSEHCTESRRVKGEYCWDLPSMADEYLSECDSSLLKTLEMNFRMNLKWDAAFDFRGLTELGVGDIVLFRPEMERKSPFGIYTIDGFDIPIFDFDGIYIADLDYDETLDRYGEFSWRAVPCIWG